MKRIVEFIVDLSDIQKEIFDEMVKEYPRSNTVGGFSDLISSKDLKLAGAKGLQGNLKNLSFEMAIENLLYNLKNLNFKLDLGNYENLVERINKLKDELIKSNSLEILLGMNNKKRRSVGYDSIEYKLIYIKHHYDILMFMNIEDRHKELKRFYMLGEI